MVRATRRRGRNVVPNWPHRFNDEARAASADVTPFLFEAYARR
jgi:hypothetical protein